MFKPINNSEAPKDDLSNLKLLEISLPGTISLPATGQMSLPAPI